MKTSERIQALLEMTNKTEIAKEIEIILEDHITNIMVEMQREYLIEDIHGMNLGGTCFINRPSKRRWV